LIQRGDHYRHLADLRSYSDAHQRLGDVYQDREEWLRPAVLNIAGRAVFERPDQRGLRGGDLAR
jgi:starch phosphorylase